MMRLLHTLKYRNTLRLEYFDLTAIPFEARRRWRTRGSPPKQNMFFLKQSQGEKLGRQANLNKPPIPLWGPLSCQKAFPLLQIRGREEVDCLGQAEGSWLFVDWDLQNETPLHDKRDEDDDGVDEKYHLCMRTPRLRTIRERTTWPAAATKP